jgi:hypothetical protein
LAFNDAQANQEITTPTATDDDGKPAAKKDKLKERAEEKIASGPQEEHVVLEDCIGPHTKERLTLLADMCLPMGVVSNNPPIEEGTEEICVEEREIILGTALCLLAIVAFDIIQPAEIHGQDGNDPADSS